LERISEAEEKSGPHRWHIDGKVIALLALRQFSAAEEALKAPELPAKERATHHIQLLAAKGEIADAEHEIKRWQPQFELDDRDRLLFAAWLGERATANAVAARIDAHPLSAIVLASATQSCACGAPFELGATPNFRKRLTEAGFDWPPPTVVEFPAKDW
jgi:hypothetical protein